MTKNKIPLKNSGSRTLDDTIEELEREREFRTLAENLPDNIVRYDREGRSIYVNPLLRKMLGADSEVLKGKRVREIYPDGSYDDYAKALDAALARGENQEIEFVVPGSERNPLVHQVRMIAVRNEHGEVSGALAIGRDITERKRAEAALASSEQQFRSLAENAPDNIVRYDLQCRARYINPMMLKTLGADPELILGKSPTELGASGPEISAEYERHIREVLKNGESRDMELTFQHRTGTVSSHLVRFAAERDTQGNITGVLAIGRDISEVKQAEVDLLRANRALLTLSTGNGALIRSTNEAQLLEAICSAAVDSGGYRMAWIGFVEHDTEKSIRAMAKKGHDHEYLKISRIGWADNELGQGPTSRAVRNGQTQFAQNIALDPTMLPWRDDALKFGFTSCIALPLMESDKCFGVLTIYSNEPDAFDSNEVKLLEEMASDLSFGIVTLRLKDAHQKQEQRLNKSMMQTIEAIASIVEMRDPYTSGHQARVAKLAESIAQKMGLPEEQVYAILLAGLVHDLGKIKIPSEIFSKPGRLDEIEYMLIKKHSQAGFDILNTVDFTWPIAQMVLQHHERMDGSGYPLGLKGDEILMGARILCVADVVEAMSSHRPYRPGLGVEAALDEISKNRGSLYDVQVVDVCVKLFKNEAYVIPK